MNRTIGYRQILTLVALVALYGAGCGQDTSTPGEGLASESSALTQDHVLPTGDACVPTGAHAKHGSFDCTACHLCGGVLQFDPNGPAVAAGQPAPTFDATAKTCSNVACHSVPSGTYTYTTWDWGSDSAVYVTVPYGGAGGAGTPSWYETGGGVGCIGCHGNPPRDYNYYWHGGNHGGGLVPGGSDCQLCHVDAVGVNGVATGLSTATNCGPTRTEPCASLHANGTLDVTPKWGSRCYGCH